MWYMLCGDLDPTGPHLGRRKASSRSVAGWRPLTPPWALPRPLPEWQGALTGCGSFTGTHPTGPEAGSMGFCRFSRGADAETLCSRLADPGTSRSVPGATSLWGKWAPVTSFRPRGDWVGLGLDTGQGTGIQSPHVPQVEEAGRGGWPGGGVPCTSRGLGQGAHGHSTSLPTAGGAGLASLALLAPLWGLATFTGHHRWSRVCTCVVSSVSSTSEGALQLSVLEK